MNTVLTRRLLLILAIALGLVLVGLSATLFTPLLASSGAASEPKQALVPVYDYEPWHGLPVEDGRIKAFETQCMELVRQLTGRTHFEGTDPVALVLAWMFLEGESGFVDWEQHAFILCDHHLLRESIYETKLSQGSRLTDQERHGKYIAPHDLRQSPKFDELLAEVAHARAQYQGKAHFHLSTVHLKAEEVGRRLGLWDSLCGRSSTRLFKNAMMGEKYLSLQEFADLEDCTPAEALAHLEKKQATALDPLRFVSLPELPGDAWVSLTELRRLQKEPARWKALVESRLADHPELLFSHEHAAALRDFEAQIRAGTATPFVDELAAELQDRSAAQLKRFQTAQVSGDTTTANRLLAQVARSPEEQERLRRVAAKAREELLSPELTQALLTQELRNLLEAKDLQVVQRLRTGSARPVADVREAHLLGLLYMDARFPEVYQSANTRYDVPIVAIDRVLSAADGVRKAYRGGDAQGFANASEQFIKILGHVGDGAKRTEVQPYLQLELVLNRMQPFRWAWCLMLLAAVLYLLSVIAPQGASGAGVVFAYLGAICFMLGLLVQIFAFTLRIAVAGRAPVGNMYETVVFVAFLSALFALLLEAIYRRRVIALAGATVATLGLMLADQLPLALDPKISPLVPVLRSNFWLTVHVVTIVASYAGATLAWGLGNISLALLAFGKPNRETLKTLSLFTYRAMQIAVVLLATGTFLGGWWASEAWGRFWGWDPKEVGALIALVCYVIPLHARYAGWIKDFGLAVAAVLCYAAIILSWYVVNFVIAAGLHSYGFSGGGGEWVLWAGLLNLEWVLVATLVYLRKNPASGVA